MNQYPRIVAAAIECARRNDPCVSQDRRIDHVWFTSTGPQRDEFDRWLVATQHRLAYEAGTAEYRFRSLVTEILECT